MNEEFERFAEHYGVTVVPARVHKPRDKSPVENAVKLTYKDIFTHIESLHCPDLKSLNAAIRSALELHNNRLMTSRKYSYYCENQTYINLKPNVHKKQESPCCCGLSYNSDQILLKPRIIITIITLSKKNSKPIFGIKYRSMNTFIDYFSTNLKRNIIERV